MISENEICSLSDIMMRYGLSDSSPMLYAIYIHENPTLTEEEKEQINTYIDILKRKKANIDRMNLAYMNRDKDITISNENIISKT